MPRRGAPQRAPKPRLARGLRPAPADERQRHRGRLAPLRPRPRADRPARVTTSRHARRAIELLELIDRQEDELARIEAEDVDRHLELVAGGLLGRLARSRQWSAELAIAHALAAIAVSLEELNVDLPQNASQWLEDVKASIRGSEASE